jgi:drug/metabolite transporter (DMT)-like permease
VAVFGRLTGGQDRLTPVRWAGLLLGLGGVALLVAGNGTRGDATSVAEVLGVAVCYAIGPLIAARKLSNLPSLGMTAVCLAFATVIYAPIAAVDWPSKVPSGTVLASLAGLAVVCTALAFVLFFALIGEAGPARASVITYVNPAVAVGLGVLALGEKLTPTMAFAFALILGGSVLATRTARPAAERASAAGGTTVGDGLEGVSLPAGATVTTGNAVSAGTQQRTMRTGP